MSYLYSSYFIIVQVFFFSSFSLRFSIYLQLPFHYFFHSFSLTHSFFFSLALSLCFFLFLSRSLSLSVYLSIFTSLSFLSCILSCQKLNQIERLELWCSRHFRVNLFNIQSPDSKFNCFKCGNLRRGRSLNKLITK